MKNKPRPAPLHCQSTVCFHAVNSIRTALSYAGFTEIREEDPWQIERGGKYVVTRNGSALMAFTIPEDGGHAFRITASHGDSPSLKSKKIPNSATLRMFG